LGWTSTDESGARGGRNFVPAPTRSLHHFYRRDLRMQDEIVAGFAAFKNHLSYLPFSGSVLGQLADELEGYTRTKSALHFPVDRALPKALVEKLIAVRLTDAGLPSR